MAVLCIDAGTSVIKAVAFDDDGRELVLARETTEVRRPRPGFAEQDMDEVWNAVVFTVRTILRQLAEDVRLIAFTAQGDGCWLVDRAGRPVGPAILWNDGRAAAIVEQWRAAGRLEEAFRRNGSLTFAGLPNSILAWLKANEPDQPERADKSLYCGGWLFLKLTGELAVDESDASAPFLDIRARRYSDELLRLYELEWAQRLLPAVRTDDQRVGELRPAAATELGLAAGLPVVMAPYDIAATAFGVGAVAAGQACSILGTTLCTEVITPAPQTDGEPSGLTIALGMAGGCLRAFPTLAGAEVITWAMRVLGLREPDELSALARRAPVGAGGLWCMPYLSPAGERAPFLNTAARGSFIGLSFEHGREHVARAVLEGLTLVIRDCFEASQARPPQLRLCGLCGGGSNSELWCQLIADVGGVPTFRSEDREVGAKGAFLSALVATGAEPDLAAAARAYVRAGRTYEPDPERSARYQDLYDEFLALRDVSAQAWQRLAEARSR